MSTPMEDGRRADSARRRQRVQIAIKAAVRDGTPVTTSAIARAASVDRTFLYRHRDMLDLLHAAASDPPQARPSAPR
ncbi:hypothetical protein [Streptomyces inhibens]|uniref:hypothetical protein n=1 Tax=Streptomyces inhibens TaxID=2293571 RepID=UPI001FD2874B|nr:hypothetical protein [Streptomyces inhibens]